jgi:hypothetical protein
MKTYLIIILLSLFSIQPVIAQDYSNDFEDQINQWENDNYNSSISGDNDPIVNYYRIRDELRNNRILKEIEKRQRYEYRPYSPNVYEKRRTYNPKDVDWSNPWYRK